MIILEKWYGRLGNNIYQLSNIIDIALAYKHNIIFNVEHSLFNLSMIENNFSKYNNSKIITDKVDFFGVHVPPSLKKIFEQNIEERNKILKDAFLIKNINKLPETDLVIHIRSGDIFSSSPHPDYVPPPLSYYIKQIYKYKLCQKIIIVCEDRANPVVNKLLELYKNSVYKKNNLEEDIKLLLGATNVIPSVGTFVPALMLMSDNVKYPYGKCFHPKEKPDYYIIMLPWENTQKQRDYILTYPF